MKRGVQGHVRKLIAFDEDTFDKLKQLGRDQMLGLQDLADEAFSDLLEKHGIPADLKDALRQSAALDGRERKRPTPKMTSKTSARAATKRRQARKPRS
jgi:hypothetical protein